ncbi:hypothetical protein SLEP1_g26424 [Rubroshorea leprosula]|uniref:C2H2-type domain-containing protein n=1 Tax=Rubroshorea leprosula TaxID=152421 RepID=A0AAV5JLT1_9ROSI|nr:hypothetical protein SLEP1_g26424 [Rubroshorea leprosula]
MAFCIGRSPCQSFSRLQRELVYKLNMDLGFLSISCGADPVKVIVAITKSWPCQNTALLTFSDHEREAYPFGVVRQRKQYVSREEEGFSLLFVIFTLPVTERRLADMWKNRAYDEEELIKYIDMKCSFYGEEFAGKGVSEPQEDDDVEWQSEKPEAEDEEWTCTRCWTKLGSRTELDNHWKVEHPLKILKCPECNQECAGWFELDHHMEDAHPKEAHSCHCGLEFESRSQLEGHRIEEHWSRREYICSACHFHFNRRSEWEDHYRECIVQHHLVQFLPAE